MIKLFIYFYIQFYFLSYGIMSLIFDHILIGGKESSDDVLFEFFLYTILSFRISFLNAALSVISSIIGIRIVKVILLSIIPLYFAYEVCKFLNLIPNKNINKENYKEAIFQLSLGLFYFIWSCIIYINAKKFRMIDEVITKH